MPQTNKNPLLGAHLSVAGGLDQAIVKAEQLNCTAVQFFSKSNRQWHANSLSTQEIEKFKQARTASSVRSTVIHASYLINIGSSDQEMRNKATAALQEELTRAEQLEVDHLVFHPGSHKNGGEIACLDLIASNINRILNNIVPGKTRLSIETMAGQGTNVGSTFEELAHIYNAIEQKDRVGFCLDTCHIFAAGYDILTKEAYQKVMAQFDATLGLNKLHAIHLNDSKKPLGSRVDRHEHIGQGQLGLEPFRYIMNDIRFDHVPKILETPKDNDEHDAMNLAVIRSLIEG